MRLSANRVTVTWLTAVKEISVDVCKQAVPPHPAVSSEQVACGKCCVHAAKFPVTEDRKNSTVNTPCERK